MLKNTYLAFALALLATVAASPVAATPGDTSQTVITICSGNTCTVTTVTTITLADGTVLTQTETKVIPNPANTKEK